MNKKNVKKNWVPKSAFVLALMGSASVSWAATQIVLDTFDNSSELGNWGANGSALTWTNNQDAGGSATVGCMRVQYSAATNTWGTQPQRNLGSQTFDESQYWSVSFDFKIDPNSSYGSDTANAPYGHVQVIPVDSGWNWLSGKGWTALTTDYTNWHHLEIGFTPPYAALNALVFQVGDNAFTNDVIFYVDNIKVNPIPATNYFNQFTNANELSTWTWANWSQPGSNQWVSTPDAGGANPAGSMQIYAGFLNNPSNYQQVVFYDNVSFDPSRFTFLDMDVRLDPNSYISADGADYGDLNVIIEGLPGYFWAGLGSHSMRLSDTNWTHLSYAIGGHGLTNADKIILQLGRGWSDANGGHGMTNSVTYYVDNVKLWSPQAAPRITKLQPGTPGGGLQLTMNQLNNQYERDGITTPVGPNYYSWANSGGITYSFTITNFPDAKAHPGFDAHMYMVNAATCPNESYNETYGGTDWNAADMVDVRVQNNANGGVDFSFRYKTNLPSANPDHLVTSVHAPSALGTWTVAFDANLTNVTMTGPGGVSTNFTLDPVVAAQLSDANDISGPQMFLHFGAFKDNPTINNADSGMNDGSSMTFSHIQIVPVNGGWTIDDTFGGPSLTTTYAWRATAPGSTQVIPSGTAWWMTWTTPDDGYSVVSSSNVRGPYTDAGVTFTYASGATRTGAVPAASLPAGSAVFFRLVKTQ